MSNKPTNTQQQIEDDYSDLMQNVQRTDSFIHHLKYIPFAVITAAVGVLLYITVGGIDLQKDMNFVIGGYAAAVIGLTFSYSYVNTWGQKQKASQSSSNLWFSLFYNNAFYVFMLLFFSQIVCSGMNPTTSMIIAQVTSSVIPAWLSHFSAK